MINFKKRQMIERLISMMTKEIILGDLRDVIAEVKAGKWPDDTPLFALTVMPITVGMTKRIPNWETNPIVIQNMTSTLIGRYMRHTFIKVGATVDYSNSRDEQFIIQIAQSTDAVQDAACVEVVGAEVHKHFKEHEHEETVKLIELMCAVEEAEGQTKQ